MPSGLADLLHDAAVVHKFVDFIEDYCGEQRRSQTYVDASGLFFLYVEKLTIGIKLELGKEVKRATKFPARIPLVRRNILTLKYFLQLLHTLIKPAADAHTLTIPAPLIDLAAQQLQRVKGMKSAKVVILLTPELMYFQRPHTHVKQQAKLVQTFIPAAVFPAKLGFIELPYSQGPSFFTNLAIHHEIAHFVFEELSSSSPPYAEMVALRSATIQSLSKRFKNHQVFALARKIVESWIQEIFCDLFAIRLLGPAFSFALVEILGMLGFLSEQEAVTFSTSHPAIACRFAEHLNMLNRDGWLDAISDVDPQQKRLLSSLGSIPRRRYKFYLDDTTLGPQPLVDAFLDSIVPAIQKLVVQITPDPRLAVKRFKQCRSTVEECLRAGVVPSVAAPVPLDPISIINSAFCFYLTSLPRVLEKFEKPEDKNNVEKHSLWMRRFEMWTMKAIEDAQIQAHFKKVSS